MNGPLRQVYRFDSFQVDESKRQLLREGRPVPLSRKAFDLLLVLLENNGRAVTKNELLDKVWPDQFVEEVNLTVQVAALRKALCEQKDNARYILTIPRHGYRFVAEFRTEGETKPIVEPQTASRFFVQKERIDNGASDASQVVANFQPPGLSPDDQAAAAQADSSKLPGRRVKYGGGLLVGGGLVLVLAVGIGIWRFNGNRTTEPPLPFQRVTIEQLTSASKAVLAALSPDGTLFVYVSRNRGMESLLLAHIEGGEPKELIPPADVTYRSLKFSPNGGSIYYNLNSAENLSGALFRIPTFGGVPERLRENSGGRITFSPDLKLIAFARHDPDKKTSSLVLANADNANERELVSRPESLPFRSFSPSWSPDGRTIAVSAPVDEVGWRYEVFVVSVADGQIRPLTSSSWGEVLRTEWLSDGSGLVAAVREKNRWDTIRLWRISYPGGSASRIVSDLDSYSGAAISLSSDGKLLLTIQDQRITGLWVAPADHLGRKKQVASGSFGRCEGCSGLAWMPDGSLIYTVGVNGSASIWTMDADGGNQKQLTSNGHVDIYLSVTDDGRYVVFQSNRSGSWEIWRANTDGSDMKQLTAGGMNEQPHVSPDGRWVVYTSLRDGLQTVWRVSIEGGEPVRLSDDPASWPQVSPDGKLVACGFGGKLAIIPIEGGPPANLFDIPRSANFDYGIRWKPDGKGVTYRDWVSGIWSQPMAGGNPKRLEGLPEEKLGSYGWSRDGRKFGFLRGSEMREVVLIRSD